MEILSIVLADNQIEILEEILVEKYIMELFSSFFNKIDCGIFRKSDKIIGFQIHHATDFFL